MAPTKRRAIVVDLVNLATTNANALIEKAAEAAVEEEVITMVEEATAVVVAVAITTRKTPKRSLHLLQLRLCRGLKTMSYAYGHTIWSYGSRSLMTRHRPIVTFVPHNCLLVLWSHV